MAVVNVLVQRDAYLQQDLATNNYGSEVDVIFGMEIGDKDLTWFNGIVRYDLNDEIPAGSTVTAADWYFYVTGFILNLGGGMVYKAGRVNDLKSDWNESTVNWSTHGSAFTTPDTTFSPLYGFGWQHHDFTDLAVDAWDNRSGICTFIPRRTDGTIPLAADVFELASKEYDPGVLDSYLRVTYTPPVGGAGQRRQRGAFV